jgi:uncharacterized GH25 family protein
MTRLLLTALAAFLWTASSLAHHIWIIPERPEGPKATAVFGDTLEPQSPDILKKVAHTRLFVREASGNEELVEWTKGESSFALEVLGKGTRTIGGTCIYGVETMDHRMHKHVDPYLLIYHPKTVFGHINGQKPWNRLPLEIMAEVIDGQATLKVLFRGKPVPNAEMIIIATGRDKVFLKPNEKGESVFEVKQSGVYGFRTRHIEPKEGVHFDKKYKEVRHYASLVLRLEAK